MPGIAGAGIQADGMSPMALATSSLCFSNSLSTSSERPALIDSACKIADLTFVGPRIRLRMRHTYHSVELANVLLVRDDQITELQRSRIEQSRLSLNQSP